MYSLSREGFFHPLPLFLFGYSAVAPFLPARYGMLSRAQVYKEQRPSSKPLKLYLLVPTGIPEKPSSSFLVRNFEL
jgi:hypothetical protein